MDGRNLHGGGRSERKSRPGRNRVWRTGADHSSRGSRPGPDSGPKPLDKIHVAVQVDLSDQEGILRLAVDGTYDDLTISRIPEADATAADTLKGFFKWVAADFPALRYCVVFWGHSSGPVGLFGDRASPNGPVNRLTLPKLRGVMHQFASALKATGKGFVASKTDCYKRPIWKALKPPKVTPVDIVLFKDCWMSTLETAYELQKSARFMIASPAKVPQKGWPYERDVQVARKRADAMATTSRESSSLISDSSTMCLETGPAKTRSRLRG